MTDYSEYKYTFSEILNQIMKKERIKPQFNDKIKKLIMQNDGQNVYYKEYPYKTPLSFSDPTMPIEDILETRVKPHMMDCIVVILPFRIIKLDSSQREELEQILMDELDDYYDMY